jgi:hypothetical protein
MESLNELGNREWKPWKCKHRKLLFPMAVCGPGPAPQVSITYTYIYLILYIDRGEKTLAKFRYGQTSIGRVCNHMHTRADAADICIGPQRRKTKRAAAFCIQWWMRSSRAVDEIFLSVNEI